MPAAAAPKAAPKAAPAPVKEITRELFHEWTQTCGVRKIQAEFEELAEKAKENGRTAPEELAHRGIKDYVDFGKTCPRFSLFCSPSEFAELGSGYVLYFHFLAFLMAIFVVLFVLQLYPMIQYGQHDWILGWQWNDWLHAFNTNQAKACECVGKNNGMIGVASQSDYGTYCKTWDLDLCQDQGTCQFNNPGLWVCGSWCYADANCPAPERETGDSPWMSNRVQVQLDNTVAPDQSGYPGLVRSYSACGQDDAVINQCELDFRSADEPYNEKTAHSEIDLGDEEYAISASYLTPGNYGPDQADNSVIPTLYLVCVVAMVVLIFFAYQAHTVVDVNLDAGLTSPNDYAVLVHGLPLSATDEKAIADWFKRNSLENREVDVVKVVIGWDHSEFSDKIKELRDCSKKMKETAMDDPNRKMLQDRIDELQSQLASVAPDKSSSSRLMSSGVVVVVYRYQADMRAVCRRWNNRWVQWFYREGRDVSWLPEGNAVLLGEQMPKFPFGDRPIYRISVERAPNPGDIHWEELGVERSVYWKKLATTNSVMALLILVCLLITWGFNELQEFVREQNSASNTNFGFQILSLLPAIGVAVTNVCITMAALRLGAAEYHETWTEEEFSQALKMSVGMTLNTAGIIYWVNAQPKTWYRAGGLISDGLIFLIVTSVLPTIFLFIDIGWLFKCATRRKLTDKKISSWNETIRQTGGKPKSAEEAQQLKLVTQEVEYFKRAYEPSQLRYVRRFAMAIKTSISCIVFSPVFPWFSLIGFFGIFLQYWTDKYLLLRWFKRPERPANKAMPIFSVKFLKYILPFLFGLTSWLFLTPSWKNKNLTYSRFAIASAVSLGFAIIIPLRIWTKPLVKMCSKRIEDAADVDYYQAQHFWPKEMRYHKDQFVYKKLPESVNPEFLSPETEATKAEDVRDSYGVAIKSAAEAAADTSTLPTRLKMGTIVAATVVEPVPVGGDPAPAGYGAVVEEPPTTDIPVGTGGSPSATKYGAAAAVGTSPLLEPSPGGPVPIVPTPATIPAAAPAPDPGFGPKKVVWEFEGNHKYHPFGDDAQAFIESRYQSFKYAGGKGQIDKLKTGGVTVSLDFTKMTQKKDGAPVRKIRRSMV